MALQGASESGHSAIPESVLSTSRSLPCHKVGMKLEKEVERVVELEQAKNMLEIAGTVIAYFAQFVSAPSTGAFSYL